MIRSSIPKLRSISSPFQGTWRQSRVLSWNKLSMLVLNDSIANQLFKGYQAQLISTRSIPNWGTFQVKNLHMTQKNEKFQILRRFQWDVKQSYFHVDPFQIEVHSKSKICIWHIKMKFFKFCMTCNGIASEAIWKSSEAFSSCFRFKLWRRTVTNSKFELVSWSMLYVFFVTGTAQQVEG